jgi:hypothetical protein
MTQTHSTLALPDVITSYLQAHQARRLDAAIGSYTAAASVTDEGKTYTGVDEIKAWLAPSASEYTYTIHMTAAEKIDESHYDVTHHLEGTFPGGQVDLHFRFTLRHSRISRLVIEE